jgi:hypothetical protein
MCLKCLTYPPDTTMLVLEMGRERLVAGAVIVLALSGLSGTAWAETSITTSNTTDNVDTESGDAHVHNSMTSTTGQQGEGDEVSNEIQGDIDAQGEQSARTLSGAAVSGQVVGGVSEDDLSIDASNLSVDSTAQTGESNSDNDADILAGLVGEAIGDVNNESAGEINGGLDQGAHSVSGDAVTGQYIGAQTYSGDADVVVANVTEDSSSEAGDSEETNNAELSIGQFINGIEV